MMPSGTKLYLTYFEYSLLHHVIKEDEMKSNGNWYVDNDYSYDTKFV